MNQDAIFRVLVENTRELLPELNDHNFSPEDSLRALGANSIDRAEIITMTLEAVKATIPLVELAEAADMGELAGIIHARSRV